MSKVFRHFIHRFCLAIQKRMFLNYNTLSRLVKLILSINFVSRSSFGTVFFYCSFAASAISDVPDASYQQQYGPQSAPLSFGIIHVRLLYFICSFHLKWFFYSFIFTKFKYPNENDSKNPLCVCNNSIISKCS